LAFELCSAVVAGALAAGSGRCAGVILVATKAMPVPGVDPFRHCVMMAERSNLSEMIGHSGHRRLDEMNH
jgi:hypothetical protein